MASPVGGTNQGNGDQELWAQIRQVIRQEIAAAARGGIGLHVDGVTGNLIIDKGEVQSGNYAAGSAGWALMPTGDAEFNNLTLRAGIIGNDALANPTIFGSVGASSTGALAVTTAGADVVPQSITIPAGFTRATILCITDATIANTSGTGDYAYVSASINSLAGGEVSSWVANGFAVGISSSAIRSLTGLTPGGTIPVAGHLRTGTVNFPAQTATSVNVNAIALFLR